MRRALFSLLTAAVIAAAAGTAGADTASAAVAAIPASPIFESSAPFATWNDGGFIINNNAWNPSTGPQTIWADSYGNWEIASTDGSPMDFTITKYWLRAGA
jgi:hypothetical protein